MFQDNLQGCYLVSAGSTLPETSLLISEMWVKYAVHHFSDDKEVGLFVARIKAEMKQQYKKCIRKSEILLI